MRAGNAGSSLNYVPALSRVWGGQNWPNDYVNCLSMYRKICIPSPSLQVLLCALPTLFLIAAFVGFNCWQEALRHQHAEAGLPRFGLQCEWWRQNQALTGDSGTCLQFLRGSSQQLQAFTALGLALVCAGWEATKAQYVTSFLGWHLPACLFSSYCVLIKFSSSVCSCAFRFIETVGYSSTKTVPRVFHQIASNLSPSKALHVFA